MTKSTVTTRISAAFLAAVLVAGTIALSSPSFMLGAQAEPYFGMDKKYDSYGSNYDSYGKDSYDKKPYPPRNDYGMDKPYPPKDDYGKDSYDKKPYGDTYGQDYPSYKPIYKKDPYGKDRDYDKSKDSSSVSIKKLKCNNINVNLNNIDATFGSPSPPPTDGPGGDSALAVQGGESVAANGLMNDGRDGKKVIVDRENNFAFVCINNNNNVGAGNATDNNVTDPCEDCFAQNLNATAFANVTNALSEGVDITLRTAASVPTIEINSFAELCDLIELTPNQISSILNQVLEQADVSLDDATFEDLLECIETALGIDDGPG